MFKIERKNLDWCREFVSWKRLNLGDYQYTQSDIIREGISLLKEKYGELPNRPMSMAIPTKGGRVAGEVLKEPRKKTSFRISEIEREFIYNLIFFKLQGKINYTKENFLEEIINLLSLKYDLKFSNKKYFTNED